MANDKDEKRKAKLDAKTEQGKKGNALTCSTVTPIGRIAAGDPVKLMLYGTYVEIKGGALSNRKEPHLLMDYDQITDVFYGLCTVNSTEGDKDIKALVIQYKDSEGGTSRLILNMKNVLGGKDFAEDLKVACGLDKPINSV
ncbi:MAG: hypothetical protein LUD25_05560, partial [Coriobacteriaceae bacterium]|nr:hypothetical protein [Coriobacteriaceae bacterium]